MSLASVPQAIMPYAEQITPSLIDIVPGASHIIPVTTRIITALLPFFSALSSFIPAMSDLTSKAIIATNDVWMPQPVKTVVQALLLVHFGSLLSNRVAQGIDGSYLVGMGVNLVIGHTRVVSIAAQVVLILRKIQQVAETKNSMQDAYKKCTQTIKGVFPTEITLLQDIAATSKHPQSLQTFLLNRVPTPIMQKVIRVEEIADAIGLLFQRILIHSLSYLELGTSIFIDNFTQFDANNAIFSNIGEMYRSLEQNPSQITREIENNEEMIDRILSFIGCPMTAKELAANVASGVEKLIEAKQTGESVWASFVETTQKASVMFSSLAINSSFAPFGVTAGVNSHEIRSLNGDSRRIDQACKATN